MLSMLIIIAVVYFVDKVFFNDNKKQRKRTPNEQTSTKTTVKDGTHADTKHQYTSECSNFANVKKKHHSNTGYYRTDDYEDFMDDPYEHDDSFADWKADRIADDVDVWERESSFDDNFDGR